MDHPQPQCFAQLQQTTLLLQMAQPQSFRRSTLAWGNWPNSTREPSAPAVMEMVDVRDITIFMFDHSK
jgi:hypothetical protein